MAVMVIMDFEFKSSLDFSYFSIVMDLTTLRELWAKRVPTHRIVLYLARGHETN
jgi:hypothetical protein